MHNRLETLMRNVPETTDAVLVTSDINRRYYTGFPSSAGTVLATRKKSWLIIDSRYYEAAAAAVKSCEVVLQDKLYEQIAALLHKENLHTVGVEEAAITLADFRSLSEKLAGFELSADSGVSRTIDRQRMVKTPEEVDSILRAQCIAEETLEYILDFIEPGMTEQEVALEMEMYSRSNGSQEAAFSFIVAVGKNTSKPHAVPGNTKIESGDFVMMDFGATVGGYRSDMTRTVAVGKVSEKQREVYETVQRAQKEALDAIRPGAVCRDVDRVARDIIDATRFKGLFGHSLGHSLGLEIHESPNFSPNCETQLEPGIIMSVEPGIYLPGEFGVRIEDIVEVTPSGYRNLVSAPKELLIL